MTLRASLVLRAVRVVIAGGGCAVAAMAAVSACDALSIDGGIVTTDAGPAAEDATDAPGTCRAGDLDPTFGSRGVVAASHSAVDVVNGMTIDGRGRILVFGNNGGAVFVSRFLADGTRDRTFGVDGRVVFANASGARDPDVVLQRDDSVIVAHVARVLVPDDAGANAGDAGLDADAAPPPPVPVPAVTAVRLKEATGAYDPTYDAGAIELPEDFLVRVRAVALPDDRVVVASRSAGKLYATRLDTQAKRDPTFGSDGRAGPWYTSAEVAALALRPDGSMVIVATVNGNTPEVPPGVARAIGTLRILPTGALDKSFAGKGFVVQPIGLSPLVSDAVVDGTGRVVITAETDIDAGTAVDTVVTRFTANGRRDTAFGNGGFIADPREGIPANDVASVVRVDRDDRVVVASRINTVPTNGEEAVMVRRLLPNDGALDPSFADGGTARYRFTFDDDVVGIAFAPDGKLLLAIRTSAPGDLVFGILLVRICM